MELTTRTKKRVTAGRFYPLGATLSSSGGSAGSSSKSTSSSSGVNFALFSRHATEVWLCLFDKPEDGEPTDVIRLENRTRFTFHAFVEGIKPGQLYGYRVRGPFDPNNGHRFNDNKLLIDPYARALSSKAINDKDNRLLAYKVGDQAKDQSFDDRDDAAFVPKAIVIDDNAFDWQGDQQPNIPFEQLIVYEVHLKGFTAHPSSKVSSPGSYLGFIEKIPHLKELGINAIELLPLHERHVGDFLTDKGLTNYWGYDTLGFFAPESAYRSANANKERGAEVNEFKTLVRELHKANIEVILDVVYNHTAEGSELGPTLSFRGIDNATYYALTGAPHESRRYYENWSGCGNSLNLADPFVIRFVMDSLRYWVEVMHVDGFRFDLASILGRQDGRFQRASSFFDAVSQDPVLSRVKLIAEPWDLGTYEVGNFPVDWSEWNGKFRDNVRKFEKGDSGQVKELGYRLTGSSDLYGDDGRSAYNTVNFVTCHDGFTLYDLVSYDHKHNDANLEDNRDGSNDNASWNSGVEGETDNLEIVKLRERRAKSLICQLLFSAGTPMLLGGDEMLRSQRGNNNAYCQDNDISWFDWSLLDDNRNRDFFNFVKKTIAFTRRYPVLMRRTFFSGKDDSHDQRPDIKWYGFDLNEPNWSDAELRTVSYQLDGAEAEVGSPLSLSSTSRAVVSAARGAGYLVFVSLNASWDAQRIRVPDCGPERKWRRVIDTSQPAGKDFNEQEPLLEPADHFVIAPRSTVVLLAR
jgi:isoamylase